MMKEQRLQRMILVAGCCLAFGAAFANIGVVLVTGTSVSHLTGDISRLSMELSRSTPGIFSDALRVAAAAASFFLGAFLSGLLIHHPSLDLARPYGRTLIGIGLLFVVAAVLIVQFPVAGIALAAFACGLQNALATRYRGIVLRTTHVTGLITDFGITLGMSVRGLDVPAWKIVVPAMLSAAFFLGGAASSAIFFFSPIDPILSAGLVYVAAGIGWSIFKHVIAPRFGN